LIPKTPVFVLGIDRFFSPLLSDAVHADFCFILFLDRKKDLVKLQAGEYVSLGKVESELKTCPVVENICVYGDSSKHFCVALVVPNPSHLMQLTSSGPDVSFEELCLSPQAEKAVLKELEIHAKKGESNVK